MTNVIELRCAYRALPEDERSTATAQTLLFPLVVAHQGWLRKEAIRIAANVRGASIFNVRRILTNRYHAEGIVGPELDAQVAGAIDYIAAVIDAVGNVGRSDCPSPRGKGGAA